MELRRIIFILFTYALLGLDCTEAAEIEERSTAKPAVNGEKLSEGKTQKESESLADVNGMNQQVSNMAGGFGSTDSRTNDDSQLQEFASEDKVENDELNEQTPKKRVRRWFGSTSRSGSSSSRRRTFSSRRRASYRRTFSSRRRTFSSRRRTFSSRRRTFFSRRRAFSSRRRTFSSRRRTFSSRRRVFSSRRRTISSRRRTLSRRRWTFFSRRRTLSSRRRAFSSRRRTFSSRRRAFSSRRRVFSSRRRTISSRRRTRSRRRWTFFSRRRTFSSRRRTFSSRRRTFSSRRRAFSSRRRTFVSRRRAISSRRRTLSTRRRAFSSRRRVFSSRRRTFSSRRRTICKRQANCSPTTKERTPEAKGRDVVTSVVSQVEKELGGTHGLLGRTAIVESRNGEDKNTYRKNYNGGIFQVDKIGFEDTQNVKSHPGLKKHFKTIKDKFNIDWQTVKWENLRKPLYSAIAARLYYLNKPEPIPKDLKKQAEYWKKYYNSEDKNAKGSAKKFLERVKAAENKSGG